MKNTRFIAAITAALVAGFVLGGMGIATAAISAPDAPRVASAPTTTMLTSSTWMHASQPTTITATPAAPAVPKHRASAAHAAHKSPAGHAAHQASATSARQRTSTARASHAAHRNTTSSTSAPAHQCSSTCPTHHPAATESHDAGHGESHGGGCND